MTDRGREGPSRSALLASVNRALWGEVSTAVRAVFYKVEDDCILIRFVVDGPITAGDRESASCVGGEVVADFPGLGVEELIDRVDAPARVVVQSGWEVAFIRKESQD
ncbi:hypothetical protein [Nocardia sp. NPDC056000]|uniref:hypothetical protein n=1 Tax=Nocardia sp. NPDC056000 TaxID=3345674 RepID=UPI0035E0DF87